MIAECDVFYPLQTMISDWHLMGKQPSPPNPPTPPPPPEEELQPTSPDESPNEPQPIPMSMPLPIGDLNANPRPPLPPSQPFNFNVQRPFLPTDQEIGIKPESVISDPNFNTGSHPGEIYVNGNEKSSKNRKTPARRYQTQHSKYYGLPKYYQYSPLHGRVSYLVRNYFLT